MEQEIYDAISLAVQTATAPLHKEIATLKEQLGAPTPEQEERLQAFISRYKQKQKEEEMDAIWQRKAKELGFVK